MTARQTLSGLSARIVAVHEMLESTGVAHQFGGAIALAWYRNPRATTDIDLNVTLPPESAAPVLGALGHLGVTVSDADRAAVLSDGRCLAAAGSVPRGSSKRARVTTGEVSWTNSVRTES